MFNINDDEYTYYFLNCLQHTFFYVYVLIDEEE